jgi:serine/threonine protein kinase
VRSWAPPVAFDGYELGELLGEGGMGVVYAAHDTLLDREVAVKLISTADADEVARERFVVEARAVARIQHPNVVSIYRVGEVDGHPYLVSELIHGEGLDRLPKPVPWERALQIATGIARGLATAHHRGVVHRDIKPANVILSEDGEPKLLDFGIAKLLDASGQLEPRAPRPGPSAPLAAPVDSPTEDDATRPVAAAEGLADDATNPVAAAAALDDAAPSGPAGQGLTRRGLVMGTPLYLAPELWQGQVATFRADVYSLGALLYELCSGAPPHTAASTSALGEQVRTRDARPLGEVVEAIDARFAAMIDRCLRRDPSSATRRRTRCARPRSSSREEARSGVVPDGNPYRRLTRLRGRAQRALLRARRRDPQHPRAPAHRALRGRGRATPAWASPRCAGRVCCRADHLLARQGAA